MRFGRRRAAPSAIAAAACVLLAATAAAQPEGRVHDRESGAAVVGARLEWLAVEAAGGGAESATRTSDARGIFRVAPAWGPDGAVVVTALGYRRRTVDVGEAAALGWRIALDRDPIALDPIVVTAGGRPRPRSEVAVPVETVEATEIAGSGAASVDRLLAELPGLQASPALPTGSVLLIRGIGGPRVLVLLDGRPAPGSLIENRDLSRMSLAGVDRVEVVKGPLSSRYGSDALGGVVNLITRPPDSGFRLEGRVLSGTAGRRQAHATASGGGRLRVRATGAWRQVDEAPLSVGGDGEAFARVWDLRSELGFDASRRWKLGGGWNFLRERQRWPVGGGFSGFNDNRGLSGWLEARRATDVGDWRTGVFLQDYVHLYRSARGDAPVEGDDEAQREREARATGAYSAALGDHRIDAGLEIATRNVRSPDKLVEERVGDAQAALFAQDAWRRGANTWTAGARVTWNSRWGTNVSPTLGWVRPAGSSLRLRATAARGFRAPSFKELTWRFANVGAGYALQGFPDLAPERSWSLSGGAEWSPRAGVRVDAEGYWNRIDDLIESGFVGAAPSGLLIYSPRNVSQVTTRGFEIGARAVSGRGAVAVGYAYLNARSPASDAPLDRRPSHSARVRGSWTLAAPTGARLDATAHLTGEAPILGSARGGEPARVGAQERFFAIDVQASVALWRRLELVVGVDNALDARPGGWRGLVERRFRVGVAAKEIVGGSG